MRTSCCFEFLHTYTARRVISAARLRSRPTLLMPVLPMAQPMALMAVLRAALQSREIDIVKLCYKEVVGRDSESGLAFATLSVRARVRENGRGGGGGGVRTRRGETHTPRRQQFKCQWVLFGFYL